MLSMHMCTDLLNVLMTWCKLASSISGSINCNPMPYYTYSVPVIVCEQLEKAIGLPGWRRRHVIPCPSRSTDKLLLIWLRAVLLAL